jgi:hypothetical protein
MMKNRILYALLVAVLAGVALPGCKAKKPDGMPELVPFKVKVVDGSTPIADVEVFFIGQGNTVTHAMTDASGVAEMTTSLQDYTEEGAPVGEYRVQCRKDPMAEHWKTPQEQAEMTIEERGAYSKEWQDKCDALPREVPKKWSDFDKTPLTASVPAGGGEVVFDVEGRANEK